MSTDEGTSRRGGLPAAQEELLVEAMLRHQVGIDPAHVGEVLDLAAVGFVNSAWRNSPVENWHANGGLLRDGDIIDIDLNARRLAVELSSQELEARRSQWQAPAPKYQRGWLARYTRAVTNASNGAVLE